MSSIADPCPFPSGTIHLSTCLDGIGASAPDCLLPAPTHSTVMSPVPQSGIISSAPPAAPIPTNSFFDDAIELPEPPEDMEAAFINSPEPSSHDRAALNRPNISPYSESHNATNEKNPESPRRFLSKEAPPKTASGEKGSESVATARGPKPKKRGRKPKRPAIDQNPDPEDELDEDGLPLDPRRRRILERNRIAATKCRLRKRDEASALASREHAMEDQNQYLSSYFDSLTAEVFQLKKQLLRHTDCRCVLIQKYIAHEAKKSVENMMAGSSSGSLGDYMSPGYRDASHVSSGESMKTTSEVDSVSPPWTTSFQPVSALTTPQESIEEQGMKEFPVMPVPYTAHGPTTLHMGTASTQGYGGSILTGMTPHQSNLEGFDWKTS